MAIDLFFSALRWLGATLYGGSLLAFALLLAMRQLVVGAHSERLVRVYRAWGPGLGLSMGAMILGGAVMHYRTHSGFLWPAETLADQLTIAQHVVFALLWVSSFHLEIWTMDPLRKLDGPDGISDRDAYEDTVKKTTAQALVNSTLFLVVGTLQIFMGVLSA